MGNWNTNKIFSLQDNHVVTHSSHEDMAQIATDYYKEILGKNSEVIDFPEDIELPTLSETQACFVSTPFPEQEVFITLKKMAKNKSPGLDGFTVEFYLLVWHIVGHDVTKGILYFFNSL